MTDYVYLTALDAAVGADPERFEYHRFSWYGRATDMYDEARRREHVSGLPPLLIHDALSRPGLANGTAFGIDDAIAWIRTQFEQYADRVEGGQLRDGIDWRLTCVRHSLRVGHAIAETLLIHGGYRAWICVIPTVRAATVVTA